MTTTDMQGVDDMVARLVDIEFSRARQVEANMEKQAMWKLLGVGIGSGLLGYGLYRGIAAGNRHKWGRPDEFEEPDVSDWERPSRFWEQPKPQKNTETSATEQSLQEKKRELSPTERYKTADERKANQREDMEKNSAKIAMQLLKGIGADITTGLLGNWGAGGLLKGVGRMLGATSENVLRKGLDNTKIIKEKDIAARAAKLNEKLRKTVKKQKRIYDKADEWGRTTRYITGAEGKAQGQSMLQQVGQYLASAGQKLTDVSDAAQHSYRRSLNKNFGERNLLNAVLRPTIGAASVTAPVGYMVASNMQDDNTWWAKPGQYATNIVQYASLPGLTSVAGSKIGEALEGVANQGVRDGIHLGAHATAAELANTGRLAYLMGVFDPATLSKEVATRADATLAKYLQ